MKKQYFPIMIDISELPALVIGGGSISYRKIMNLLDFGVSVRCIASEIKDNRISDLFRNNKITLDIRDYLQDDVINFCLVFAATGNRKVNENIYEDCLKYRIPVNVADVPELCTFIMPAYIKRDSLVVTVSSQGSAPFYAKAVRDRLSKFIAEDESYISHLAGILRSKLFEYRLYENKEQRNRIIDEFLNFDWADFLANNQPEDAISKLDQIMKIKH